MSVVLDIAGNMSGSAGQHTVSIPAIINAAVAEHADVSLSPGASETVCGLIKTPSVSTDLLQSDSCCLQWQ